MICQFCQQKITVAHLSPKMCVTALIKTIESSEYSAHWKGVYEQQIANLQAEVTSLTAKLAKSRISFKNILVDLDTLQALAKELSKASKELSKIKE